MRTIGILAVVLGTYFLLCGSNLIADGENDQIAERRSHTTISNVVHPASYVSEYYLDDGTLVYDETEIIGPVTDNVPHEFNVTSTRPACGYALSAYNNGYGLAIYAQSEGRGIRVQSQYTGLHVSAPMDNRYCAIRSEGDMYVRGQLIVDGTENLALKARTVASSEYNENYSASKVNDGIYGRWDEGEWASNGEKEGAWIELQWCKAGYYGEELPDPQTFNKIELRGRVNEYDQIKDAWLIIKHIDDSEGRETRIHLGEFCIGGSPKEIVLNKEESRNIVSVQVYITNVSDVAKNIGLSEIQCVYDANLEDHARFRYYQ